MSLPDGNTGESLQDRISEYVSGVFSFWWAALAVLLFVERFAERYFHDWWARRIQPWLTAPWRKRLLEVFLLLAFIYANFRAFDETSRALAKKTTDLTQVQNERDGLKAQLDELKRNPVRPTSIPEPRNPDGLYQLGQLVGNVSGAQVSENSGTASFQFVQAGGKMNFSKDVEYRQYLLHCEWPRMPPLGPNALITIQGGAQCTIVSLR